MTSSLWNNQKDVPISWNMIPTLNPLGPIPPTFNAPKPIGDLTIYPVALALSIARTATLQNAPFPMILRWLLSSWIELQYLITDDNEFKLSQYFRSLSDSERTAFAGRVGAGISDVVMTELGYVWRGNAEGISNYHTAHADFIYGGGQASGLGIVLVEAHGSFAKNISNKEIKRRVVRKYKRQVGPHLGIALYHGKVIHGYSTGFGSKPVQKGSFLSVAETRPPQQGGGLRYPGGSSPPSDSSRGPTSLVLATQRSNFGLMGASTIVAWIDWINGDGDRPSVEQYERFVVLEHSEKIFIGCEPTVASLDDFSSRVEYQKWLLARRSYLYELREVSRPPWLVMEKNIGDTFLDELRRMIAQSQGERAPSLELPVVRSIGVTGTPDESIEVRDVFDHTFVQYSDGLAMLRGPAERVEDFLWRP